MTATDNLAEVTAADLRQVASWAKKARTATERRDQLIREAHAAGGATLRAIGEAAGLSHTAIAKILRRQPADQ